MRSKIINVLCQAAIILALVVALFMFLKEYASIPYTVYVEANDGGYLPCTYYPCVVMEKTDTELVVEYKGNEYACYYEGTEVPGNTVWAGFASYEGSLELIDIK